MPILFDKILTYFECILGCPWLYSASDEGAKGIDEGTYIVDASIRSICTKDTCIGSTCIIHTWIWCYSIGDTYTRVIYIKSTSDRDVELRTLIRSEVILASSRINNCYFRSFIGLIFASINCVSHRGGWKYRSLRSSHIFDIRYINLYLWRLFLPQAGICSSITKLAKGWFIWPPGLSI